jgi:predicted transcriptional regulator
MNRTAIIRLERNTERALAQLRDGFLNAWKTGEYQGEVFAFESPAALFRVLTPERWELLERLQTSGPLDPAALSRALGSSEPEVAADCQALLAAGLVERTDDGRVCVPFAEIRADFALRGAA